jgi:hypothetical protein
MKKPLLVRLIGWAGWVFALFLAVVLYGVYTGPPRAELGIGLVLFGGMMAFCWVTWGIASGVVWVVRQGAAVRVGVPANVAAARGSASMPLTPLPFVRLYCVHHKQWVHLGNVPAHDQRTCLYVPELPGRFASPPAPEHKASAPTSPLGLDSLK